MFKKLAMNLGLRYLGGVARDIAEGKKGVKPQRFYLWLIGKKRQIGVALGCITAALVAIGETDAVTFIVGTLAGIFLSLGFIDAKWREAPRFDSTWLRFLRDHAVDVAALVAALSAAFASCAPFTVSILARLSLSCEDAATGLVALAGVLAHLGISAEAQSSRPPAIPAQFRPEDPPGPL